MLKLCWSLLPNFVHCGTKMEGEMRDLGASNTVPRVVILLHISWYENFQGFVIKIGIIIIF